MPGILIVYSTTDGQTLRICERLREVVAAHGQAATLVAVEQAGACDVAAFDKIVIGARIRYGKHSPLVFDFVRRHRAVLEDRPSAFFSVNVVARKPEKNAPDTNPYVRKFLGKARWQPLRVGVFAGRIDYPRYGALDRMIIRFIMWITKGPTDPTSVVEFTDWGAVEAFGRQIADMERGGPSN